MKNLKVWPHLVLVAVVCAVAAGAGVALWMKHEQTVNAEALPDAARIQRIEGEVALNNADAANAESDQWIPATANQPFSVGDRIYTRDNSRASVAFTGRNFARLNPNTSLDVISLNERRTQLGLRDGSAVFDVGYLNSDDLFEVATPYGAVDFQQPGLYNVGISNGQVLVSVLSGLAQVVGLGGNGQVNKGELLTLVGQTATDVVLSQLDGRDAGYLVDDYYGYQYPQYYDGRYRDYNAYLNDPYYFDPYRRNATSYQYVNSYIPGIYDLDSYGDWQNVDGYGNCWAPRVDAGWSPYQAGYWYTDYPYGPTWVSSEPWGYAPYHYGRWAFAGDRWYWVPDNVSTSPIYSPALVAFVPFSQNEIGWVPLGPGDPYIPRYYDNSWQPHYLSRGDQYQRVVNLDVPNAVTVVSVDDFVRGTDWRRARKADRNMLAQVNPVLDPLLVTPLRNAVVNSAWGRGKIDIPPGIARKLRDTPVITSIAPRAPAFRPELAKAMRVETVPERAKSQKFQARDERRGGVAQQPAQGPETRPESRPAGQPPNAGSQGEQQRVEQEQRRQQAEQQRANRAAEVQPERAARPPRQQAQGERVAAPAPRQQQQQQRREVAPPQPQVRREPGSVRSAQPAPRVSRPSQPQPVRPRQQAPVRSQPAPQPMRRPEAAPAPRAQPQPRPAAPAPRAQPQPRPAAPAPRAQPQPRPAEPAPRAQPPQEQRQQRPPQAQQKQQRPAAPAQPAQKGGGKPKKP